MPYYNDFNIASKGVPKHVLIERTKTKTGITLYDGLGGANFENVVENIENLDAFVLYLSFIVFIIFCIYQYSCCEMK